DYISTYAPTFTLKRQWVVDFARAIEVHPAGYRWKACTTLHHLDEELIDLMARSRCLRISVGLETLDPTAQSLLPKLKRIPDDHLRDVATWCRDRGVELTCFVMLGMPGQTDRGVTHTFKVLREIGARIRPTAYTPYHLLRPDMDEEDFLGQCRQIVSSDAVAGLSQRDFYQLEFGDRDAVIAKIAGADAVPACGALADAPCQVTGNPSPTPGSWRRWRWRTFRRACAFRRSRRPKTSWPATSSAIRSPVTWSSILLPDTDRRCASR